MGPTLVSRAFGSKVNQKMVCDPQNEFSTFIKDGLLRRVLKSPDNSQIPSGLWILGPGVQCGYLGIFSCFLKLDEVSAVRHLGGIQERQKRSFPIILLRMWRQTWMFSDPPTCLMETTLKAGTFVQRKPYDRRRAATTVRFLCWDLTPRYSLKTPRAQSPELLGKLVKLVCALCNKRLNKFE